MNFDALKVKNEIVIWIKEWFEQNGLGCNAVVGISGGKDSSVVAALCVEALGAERVVGVLMPNGVQHDIDMAKKLVDHLKIKRFIINIKDTYDAMIKQVSENIEFVTEQTKINLAPRIRMSALYAVSQSVNGRVANTCNLSEDWVGYATRYGDAAGDFSPLSYLTVTEVKEIGKVLELPNELVNKTPIDGLCGKTDEENLGFTYAVLDQYIRTGICENKEIKERIDYLNKINKFKLELMSAFKYNAK